MVMLGLAVASPAAAAPKAAAAPAAPAAPAAAAAPAGESVAFPRFSLTLILSSSLRLYPSPLHLYSFSRGTGGSEGGSSSAIGPAQPHAQDAPDARGRADDADAKDHSEAPLGVQAHPSPRLHVSPAPSLNAVMLLLVLVVVVMAEAIVKAE
eukprot:2748834-Rhodomonas_salina.1